MLAMVLFLLEPDGQQFALGAGRRHLSGADAGDRHGDRALRRGRRPLRRGLVPGPGRAGGRVAAGFGARLRGDVGCWSSSRRSRRPTGAPPIAMRFLIAQFAIGALAGAGLAAIAAMPRAQGTLRARAGSLAVLGGAVAAVALIYFPQCLDDPYAGLGPMLQSYWLDAVDEAQPLWRCWPRSRRRRPATTRRADRARRAGSAACAARAPPRGRADRGDAGRGTSALASGRSGGRAFSMPLACIPLALFVGGMARVMPQPAAVDRRRR